MRDMLHLHLSTTSHHARALDSDDRTVNMCLDDGLVQEPTRYECLHNPPRRRVPRPWCIEGLRPRACRLAHVSGLY